MRMPLREGPRLQCAQRQMVAELRCLASSRPRPRYGCGTVSSWPVLRPRTGPLSRSYLGTSLPCTSSAGTIAILGIPLRILLVDVASRPEMMLSRCSSTPYWARNRVALYHCATWLHGSGLPPGWLGGLPVLDGVACPRSMIHEDWVKHCGLRFRGEDALTPGCSLRAELLDGHPLACRLVLAGRRSRSTLHEESKSPFRHRCSLLTGVPASKNKGYPPALAKVKRGTSRTRSGNRTCDVPTTSQRREREKISCRSNSHQDGTA